MNRLVNFVMSFVLVATAASASPKEVLRVVNFGLPYGVQSQTMTVEGVTLTAFDVDFAEAFLVFRAEGHDWGVGVIAQELSNEINRNQWVRLELPKYCTWKSIKVSSFGPGDRVRFYHSKSENPKPDYMHSITMLERTEGEPGVGTGPSRLRLTLDDSEVQNAHYLWVRGSQIRTNFLLDSVSLLCEDK